jgi:hypothetical protein
LAARLDMTVHAVQPQDQRANIEKPSQAVEYMGLRSVRRGHLFYAPFTEPSVTSRIL